MLAPRHWKVRTWDQDRQAIPWSPPAAWAMGLLAAGDWQAQWIQVEPKEKPDGPGSPASSPMPIFRRGFELSKPVRRAMLYVCGLGQHEVRLNGRKAGEAVIEPDQMLDLLYFVPTRSSLA